MTGREKGSHLKAEAQEEYSGRRKRQKLRAQMASTSTPEVPPTPTHSRPQPGVDVPRDLSVGR